MSDVTYARCPIGCMIRDGVLIPDEECKEHYQEALKHEQFWRARLEPEIRADERERVADAILIMSNDEVIYMTDSWEIFLKVRNKAVAIARNGGGK